MKVSKSWVLDYPPHVSTVLFLDEKIPLTKWNHVKIGDITYKPLFMSGFAKDQIALRGKQNLDGMTVEFI